MKKKERQKMNKEIAKVESNSPDNLINLAIDKGADLEKLERLLILKRDYDKDEARKAYHVAMADFKANPPKIDKDKKVSFGAGKTAYSHASLFNVTEKINSELSKYGLSASWTTRQNGQIQVTCKITHVKGHSEETTLSAPSDTSGSKNAIQAIGSTITYLERYTLLAMTGLATYDQDDDGQGSSKPQVKEPHAKTEIVQPQPSQSAKNGDLEALGILAFNRNRGEFLGFLGTEYGVEKLSELSENQRTQCTIKLNQIIKDSKK